MKVIVPISATPEWCAIKKLARVKQEHHAALLRGLDRIRKKYQPVLAVRTDEEQQAEVRDIILGLFSAVTSIGKLRKYLTRHDSVIGSDFLFYLAAMEGATRTPTPIHWNEFDSQSRAIKRQINQWAKTIQTVMVIPVKNPSNRPRLPYRAVTMELIALWEKVTGEKVPKKLPSAGGRKTKRMLASGKQQTRKIGGDNATPSAKFIAEALKLIDPSVKPEQARTSIKNALAFKSQNASLLKMAFEKGGTHLGAMAIGMASGPPPKVNRSSKTSV